MKSRTATFAISTIMVLCFAGLASQSATADEPSVPVVGSTAVGEGDIAFDPPAPWDPMPPDPLWFDATTPPVAQVTCGDASAYAWASSVDMSDDPLYRTYMIVPEWVVTACRSSSTRDQVRVIVDGRSYPGYVWNWGWDLDELENGYAFASVKTTWDNREASIGPWDGPIAAPRPGWWAGLQVGTAGLGTIIGGQVVDVFPTFVDDWGVDLCPYGEGQCDWDFTVRVPYGSAVQGSTVFASNGDFLGQVVDDDWDMEDPGPGNTQDVLVTGAPATCLSVFNCNDRPESLWARGEIPTSPEITSVEAAGGSARVTWATATVDGKYLRGYPEYTVVAYPGGEECSALNRGGQPELSCVVTGLQVGDSYRFVVYYEGPYVHTHSPTSSAYVVEQARTPSPDTAEMKYSKKRGWRLLVDVRPDESSAVPTHLDYRVGKGKWKRLSLYRFGSSLFRYVDLGGKANRIPKVAVRLVSSQGPGPICQAYLKGQGTCP